MMENRDYLIILYDYYGELLKDDEKKYFEDYYFDNLSLGEIADNNGVSRNAIHKHIKSIENKLNFYEDKLKLYKKETKLKEKIKNISDDKLKQEINNILN